MNTSRSTVVEYLCNTLVFQSTPAHHSIRLRYWMVCRSSAWPGQGAVSGAAGRLEEQQDEAVQAENEWHIRFPEIKIV